MQGNGRTLLASLALSVAFALALGPAQAIASDETTAQAKSEEAVIAEQTSASAESTLGDDAESVTVTESGVASTATESGSTSPCATDSATIGEVATVTDVAEANGAATTDEAATVDAAAATDDASATDAATSADDAAVTTDDAEATDAATSSDSTDDEASSTGATQSEAPSLATDGQSAADAKSAEITDQSTIATDNASSTSDVSSDATPADATAAVAVRAKTYAVAAKATTSTSTTEQAPVSDGTYVIRTHTGDDMVLDVSEGKMKNGENVQQYEYNATAAQRWTLTRDAKTGLYSITAAGHSNLALAASGNTKGSNVSLGKATGSASTRLWRIVRSASGFTIGLANGLVLDVDSCSSDNSANIQVYKANGSAAQLFDLLLDTPVGKSEQTIPDGDYVIHFDVDENKVLDADSGSTEPGTNVQSYESNMTSAQRWHVSYDTKAGYYKISSTKDSSAVLTANALDSTGNVKLGDATGSSRQYWSIVKSGDCFSVVLAADPDLALDVQWASDENCANVDVYARNNTSAQLVEFLQKPNVIGYQTVKDGTYLLRTAISGKRLLDVDGVSHSSGANVHTWEATKANNQRWHLVYNGDGFYRIVSVNSGDALDAEKGNLVSGTNVQQTRRPSSTDSSLWAIKKNKDGTYTLICKANGLALDVTSGLAANGANVQCWKSNGTAAQRWTLSKVDTLAEGLYTFAAWSNGSQRIDVAGASTKSGAVIQTYDNNGTRAQVFQVVSLGNDSYRIRTAASGGWITASGSSVVQKGNHATATSKANTWKVVWNGNYFVFVNAATGKALAPSGGTASTSNSLTTSKASSKGSQYFIPWSTKLKLPTGAFVIHSALGTVLDVAGGATNNGANVQTWKSNNTLAQKFTIEKVGDHYRIISAVSGRVLDVDSGLKYSGANVQTWSWNGTKAQLWDVAIADGGRYSLINVGSGKALDVSSGSSAAGANVQQYEYNSTKAQAFWFEKTTIQRYSGYQLRAYNNVCSMGSSTSYAIICDKTNKRVMVFHRSNGDWNLVMDSICDIGKPSTPSPDGTYSVGIKEYSFGHGYTCYYATQITGNYLFHSVLYYPNSWNVMDGRLGMAISHGCVRMPTDNAYWMYKTVPGGSRIRLYW